MDLETENQIAAILMEEATKLRLQAEKEGVHVYLRQPKIRGRPNSRFLTATVLGVQQANRAAEVNEMWRVRKKELELVERLKHRSEHRSRSGNDEHHADSIKRRWRHDEADENAASLCTSHKPENEVSSPVEDHGLRDEEIEEFLHTRAKRGRGSIGSRLDEPGPYLPPESKGKLVENSDLRVVEEWEHHVLGPEKPAFLKSQLSDNKSMHVCDGSKVKESDSVRSKKKMPSKHRSKEHKSQDEKRKDKKSRSKH